MILTTCPPKGMLTAFVKSTNTVNFPHFSDVKIENGDVTIQVEFKPVEFTPEEIFQHFTDSSDRTSKNLPPFPYKFEYFDSGRLSKFRVSADEIKSWKSTIAESCAGTGVNFRLYEAVSNVEKALDYYSSRHEEELSSRLPNRVGANAWRHMVN